MSRERGSQGRGSNGRGSRDGGLDRPNDPGLLIMTSLAAGPKHGYALTKDIETFAGVVLGPGTLYGAITRLEERGLIEPAAPEGRRQPYRITASGRVALAESVRRMRVLADEGAARLGFVPGDVIGGSAPGWAQ